MKLKKQLLGITIASSIMLGFSLSAEAIVYTSSSETTGNRVIAFDIKDRSGNLVEIGSFETQGTGTGPRDAILTQNNQFFYTLNNGDSEIWAFRVQRSGNILRGKTIPVPASVTGIISR